MLLQDYCIVAAASSAKQDVKRMNIKNILFIVILCSLVLLCPAYAHRPYLYELSLTGGPDTCISPYETDFVLDPYYLFYDFAFVEGEAMGSWTFDITWDPKILYLGHTKGFADCFDLDQETGYISCVGEFAGGRAQFSFYSADVFTGEPLKLQPGSSTKINIDARYIEDEDEAYGVFQTHKEIYICGENNVPEFPGLILPILGVIGFLISVIYLRSTGKP